uniref:Uncharacterized protein n=1 Tax=Octopus bimaculoides TaxID=37653 RepID=A0A0L8GRJ3_OCTBM
MRVSFVFWFIEFLDVQFLVNISFLVSVSADDRKGQPVPQQQVICPAVSSPHCPSDANILDVTVPGDHIVNQVPMLGPWVHSGIFVDVRQLVQGIGDGESLLTVGILMSDAMWPDDVWPRLGISAYTGIETEAFTAWLNDKDSQAKHDHLKNIRGKVQTELRRMKDKWWENKSAELQQHSDKHNSKKFFAGLKDVYGPTLNAMALVRSADGTLLTEKSDIIQRWREHFSQLLNRPSQIDQQAIQDMPQRPVLVSLDALPPNTGRNPEGHQATNIGRLTRSHANTIAKPRDNNQSGTCVTGDPSITGDPGITATDNEQTIDTDRVTRPAIYVTTSTISTPGNDD